MLLLHMFVMFLCIQYQWQLCNLCLWFSNMLHSGVFVSKLIDLLLYVASDGTKTNDPNSNLAKKEAILCVLFPCNTTTTTTTPEVTTASAAAAENTTSTAGEMATSSAHGNISSSSVEMRPWVLWAACLCNVLFILHGWLEDCPVSHFSKSVSDGVKLGCKTKVVFGNFQGQICYAVISSGQ